MQRTSTREHGELRCCVITQRIVVISYRRFGTTIGPVILTLEVGTDMLSRNVDKKLPLLFA